ncbi:MAG: hypothetical protein LBC90_00710, partial [Candidatus Adiutrix sp.]|nr:hypothetical protein [Candidatus Adiutrix sp.]
MAFDLEKVESVLNALGLDLVMASPDNLVEVSGLLGRLEALGEGFAPLGSELPGRVLDALSEGLKAVLRGQVSRADQVLAQMSAGLTTLDELARSLPVKAPFKGDLAAFEANLAKLADAPGFWAEIETEPAPEEEEDREEKRQDLAPPPPSGLSVEKMKAQFTAAVEELQVLLVSIEQKNDPQSALGLLIRPFRTLLGAT